MYELNHPAFYGGAQFKSIVLPYYNSPFTRSLMPSISQVCTKIDQWQRVFSLNTPSASNLPLVPSGLPQEADWHWFLSDYRRACPDFPQLLKPASHCLSLETRASLRQRASRQYSWPICLAQPSGWQTLLELKPFFPPPPLIPLSLWEAGIWHWKLLSLLQFSK